MKSKVFAILLIALSAIIPGSAYAYEWAQDSDGQVYCYSVDKAGSSQENTTIVNDSYCESNLSRGDRRGGGWGHGGGHNGGGHGGWPGPGHGGNNGRYQCAERNVFGMYARGGGCNAFGCYYPGGGCNAFGCYYEGGSCNAFGCIKGHAVTRQACVQ